MPRVEKGENPATGLGALETMMARRQGEVTAAVQRRLDVFAQTRGYDSIFTAATYATSTDPDFRAEGEYAVQARDMTWRMAYQILGAVLAGARPEPTLAELMAELPDLNWPDGAAT